MHVDTSSIIWMDQRPKLIWNAKQNDSFWAEQLTLHYEVIQAQ